MSELNQAQLAKRLAVVEDTITAVMETIMRVWEAEETDRCLNPEETKTFRQWDGDDVAYAHEYLDKYQEVVRLKGDTEAYDRIEKLLQTLY